MFFCAELLAVLCVESDVLTISALLLNNYLVPRYGMEGAAMSNLLSYGLYYILIIAAIVPLGGFHVVDRKWWYIALLLTGLFAVNALWSRYAPLPNIWLDSLLRSLIVIGGGLLIAYNAELSPEINKALRDLLIP